MLVRLRIDIDPAPRAQVAGDPPPPDVEALLRTFEEDVERLGFRRLPRLEIRNLVGDDRNLAATLVDERRGRLATRYAILDAGGKLKLSYVEVISRLDGGTTILLVNSKSVGAFSPDPRRQGFGLPQVQDVGLLLRLHEEAVTRFGGGERPTPLAAEDAVPFLERFWREDLDNRQAAGYLCLRGLRLVPTWKGAVLMTWRQLVPWRWILAWRRNRRGALLLSFVTPR